MLQETKRDLTICARKLSQPYESYSFNELADAYCEAKDTNNAHLESVYFSALVLRLWYRIAELAYKLQRFGVDALDCYGGLVDAIFQACAPDNRKWQTTNYTADQVINQILNTRFAAAVAYEANLKKNEGRHLEVSLETPVCGDGEDATKTLGDTIAIEGRVDDCNEEAMISLVQSYINNNKLVEAILIDNIVFNDVQKHYKKAVTLIRKNADGQDEEYKYTEHSSEFWPYRLVQIVSKLPDTYKREFMGKYKVSEEKLDSVLSVIDHSNNQKIYRWLDHCLADLKMSYAV